MFDWGIIWVAIVQGSRYLLRVFANIQCLHTFNIASLNMPSASLIAAEKKSCWCFENRHFKVDFHGQCTTSNAWWRRKAIKDGIVNQLPMETFTIPITEYKFRLLLFSLHKFISSIWVPAAAYVSFAMRKCKKQWSKWGFFWIDWYYLHSGIFCPYFVSVSEVVFLCDFVWRFHFWGHFLCWRPPDISNGLAPQWDLKERGMCFYKARLAGGVTETCGDRSLLD